MWNGDYNSRRGTPLQTLESWTENKGREIYPCVRSCWQNNILIAELLEKLSIKSLLCRMRSTQNLLKKSDEKRRIRDREEESKTNMRVQERVSHVYAWGKSFQSTLLTFIALTFTITAFKSTGPPCVCVCTCVFNVSEVWLHSELFPQKSITDEDTDKGHPSYYEQDINDALGWNDNTLLLMTFKLKQSITIWSRSHIDDFIYFRIKSTSSYFRRWSVSF